jgi:CPA1 family monovalent cation:H+ antiporter
LGASVFTRFMSRFITVADASPGWRNPFIIGWAGMRGVVSLAAALSIPLLASNDTPFPYRNLILFITFIVILITLVFQGLTLPWIIRKLKPVMRQDVIPDHEQEMILQKKIAMTSIQYLEQKLQADGHLSEHLRNLQERLKIEMQFFNKLMSEKDFSIENPLKDFQLVYLEMLEQQRKTLQAINHKTEFDEDLIRKYLSLIDMEELKIREKLSEES